MTDRAIIYASELSFIAKCVLDYENIETGGDYFGFWNKDGIPVIQFVTGPGENTTRSSTSFYQDIPYLHRCGDFLNSNYALEHIGSWHSHHKLSLDHPSGGDISTMRHCLDTQNVNKFFITICNIIQSDTVRISGFLFSKSLQNLYEETRWVILPNDSPIRNEIERKSNFFTTPKTRKAGYKTRETSFSANKPVIISEKVELAPNSYFDTEKGRKFLKKEFDKINDNKEFKEAELIQNPDKTIAISFKDDLHNYEIVYPLDFSDINPKPILFKDGKEITVENDADTKSSQKKSFDAFYFVKIIFGIKGREIDNENNSKKINIPID